MPKKYFDATFSYFPPACLFRNGDFPWAQNKMKPQYDAIAKDFSNTRTRPWPEFDWLSPHISDGDHVLDLGCGNGRLRNYLPQNTFYTGADVSENLLKIAQEKHPDDTFLPLDFTNKWPFTSSSFDVITGIASFHHMLNSADQEHFFTEAYRVLRPGGVLFLTTWKLPWKHFWPNVLKGNFMNWNVPFQGKPRTYRWVTDRRLRRLAEKNSFSVENAFCFANRNFVLVAKKEA